MTDLALFRISFGIAAFIFETSLLLLVLVLGQRQRDNNMKFRTMVILVICGTVISIMDNIFRVSKVIDTPLALQILLQLLAIVMNVLLTYYVLLYMETFVKNSRRKNWVGYINYLIAAFSVVFTLVLYFIILHQIHAGAEAVSIPDVGRIIIGML